MDGVTNDGALNLVQNMQDFDDLQVVAVNNFAEVLGLELVSLTGCGIIWLSAAVTVSIAKRSAIYTEHWTVTHIKLPKHTLTRS